MSKTMSADQVLAAVKADPRLWSQNQPNSNLSARFGQEPSKNWRTQVFYGDIVDYISQQKSSGLSDIKTGKTGIKINPTKAEDYAETYYYFVLLEKTGSTVIKAEFNSNLNNLKAHYYGW